MRFQQLFYVVCLAITCLCIWGFSIFRTHFSDSNENRAEISYLKNKIEQESSSSALLKYQVEDLRQNIAVAIAKNDKKKLEDLLKVGRAPSSIPKMDFSTELLEKGRRSFASKRYDESFKIYKQLIAEYPLSPHVIQAQFLLAETQFIKKDYRHCLESVDKMVLQWPDHDLTGFILLRMGQISEMNNKAEEASEIYRTIQLNFKNSDLVQQAALMDKNLRLE